MTERKKKHVRLLNQAEQIRQGFLVRGVNVADQSRGVYLKARDGKRLNAVRKFAKAVFQYNVTQEQPLISVSITT